MVGSREMVQVAAVSAAVAAYVYVIGWAVTWVRLAAARLPVDASLPIIDNKVVFAAGVRVVVVMVFVFAGMCAFAYAIHARIWDKRAADWHAVVRCGRTRARQMSQHASAIPGGGKHGEASAIPGGPAHREASAIPGGPAHEGASAIPGAPAHEEAAIGDPFVRVIAGFNVGVLAATLGLGVGRLLKPVIDQIDPGQWWDLLLPWLVVFLLLVALFAFLGPLRGPRILHGLLWAAVVAVALISSAPIGLLILTWAAIATLGRLYGRHRTAPGSKVDFVLSPLPWILLTIYALVALAYYSMPPVTFSQAIVDTPNGTRVGGYLARTGTGLHLVSCTPLADATSTNELVSVVPGREVERMTTGATAFSVDSGYRPSLPTLLLHAFGVDASTPTWISPELRTRSATCTGDPLPNASVGYLSPALGAGVIAGTAPSSGQAHDGEQPIELTSPRIAALARRFQPTVLVTVADRFWPVSVGALLDDIGANGEPTCLYHVPRICALAHPVPGDLRGQGSNADDFLQYPASPALDPNPTGQLNAFLRGQQASQTPVPTLHQWLADPGLLNPWYTAQIYFYFAGKANPSRWPAPDRYISGDLIALQYWFFYPYNYYPTVVTPDLMNDAPVAADAVNTDLHQGDWEHVTVIVDRTTLRPLWLYTARHSNEGQYYPWNSPLLTFDQGHPIVEAAYGGHPTYDAHCGNRLRYAPALGALRGDVSDWVVCGSGRFAFRAATTPVVDLAKAPWACWEGHFGVASASERTAAKLNEGSAQRTIDAYYQVAGPRSPLWQAENGHLAADGGSPTNHGVCADAANPAAEETAASHGGIGPVTSGSNRPSNRARR